MKKSDLIKEISVRAQISMTDVRKVLEAFSKVTAETLTKGEEVDFPPLGKFQSMDRKARNGRNPLTGEWIQIPPKRAVRFKPSAGLKRSMVVES